MLNYYYKDTIESFQLKNSDEIIGSITLANQFDSTFNQNKSWEQQIPILKNALKGYKGTILFEFSIPRMGKRVDCLVIIENIVFVIEFKVGEKEYLNYNIDQVWDYALDLKNFHKPSHKAVLAPILVATDAKDSIIEITTTSHDDNLIKPILSNKMDLGIAINSTLTFFSETLNIEGEEYAKGVYSPTPTIIEAAVSLYNSHSVEEITRSDAGAKNLRVTASAISDIIVYAKTHHKKVISFVTGVPGAGKTLVGLKVATSHLDKEHKTASVYLSGNGPLVAILHEALTRDKVFREKERGNKITKLDAKRAVKLFIQIIHHYRDAYVGNENVPFDHVAIFDEAQRAWNKEQTINFMRRKKGEKDFNYSEPEFLISCLDRHEDWAVIVCLVGGGQEINTGEAGISEWLNAIYDKFPQWEVCISPNLKDSEYAALDSIQMLKEKCVVNLDDNLHLSVSLRSFRAESVSLFVKNILDLKVEEAKNTLSLINDNYPIVLTRDLATAKNWLKEKARGTERYGMVVSSQAYRLKPHAIDVKSPMDPVHWFLDNKDDVRSSYYLEDVATEFQIQGLELDWACVVWDGDLRYSEKGWETFSFVGSKWQNINKEERKKYLVNAYRVLLTRARQGMVIVVPEGNIDDHTRKSEYYDNTFQYLKTIGINVI
ncbi:MAG: DNA/RNA helicase domain-containing protein [Bacteroidota bacterium]